MAMKTRADHLGPIVRLVERLGVLPMGSTVPSVAVICFLMLVVVGQFFDIYEHHETTIALTRRLATLNQTSLVIIKVWVMCANRHKIRLLLGEINSHFGRDKRLFSSAHVNLLRSTDRSAITLTCIYMGLLLLSLTVPVISVVLHPHEHLVRSNETITVRRLPFRVTYPVNIENNFVYTLLMAIHLGLATAFITMPPACDGFFVGLMAHAAAHLQIVQDGLRDIGIERGDGYGDDDRAKLRECLSYHQAVLRYITHLNNVMQPILCFQFAASVGTYGTGVVYIATASSEVGVILGIMIAAFLQMGMICYFGDNIKEQSVAVADAAYAGCWYHSPLKVQRSLQLIAMRGQRPAALKIGGVIELSLATFAEVLRTSYTFFAMIREVSN